MWLPLDELTRYWKWKEETRVVDVVEYVKVLTNIELVKDMAQKNEQKQKESSSITMTKEWLTECLMLGSSSSIIMTKEGLTECLMLGSSSSITMTKEWLTECLMLGSSSSITVTKERLTEC